MKVTLIFLFLVLVSFRISAQKQKDRPVSHTNSVSHYKLSHLVGNYQYNVPNKSVTHYRDCTFTPENSENHYIILTLGKSSDLGEDMLVGRYIGYEYTSDSSVIYYTAWMENLNITKDTAINFELKKFQFSSKPIGFKTINVSQDEDKQTRIKCLNKKQLLLCELGYAFTGFCEKSSLNLRRISPAYDSRSDEMLFSKMKPKTTHECELPLRK